MSPPRRKGRFQPAESFDGEYGIEPFRDDCPKNLIGQAKMALGSEYARRAGVIDRR